VIDNDEKARLLIEKNIIKANKEEEIKMLKMLRTLCELYSFVDNQTYPRPSHPLLEKRMSPFFTLAAILISLKTTLAIEERTTNRFVNRYKSIDEVLVADEKELKDIIREAGFANKKGESILAVANYIKEHCDGDVRGLKEENALLTRKKLLSIPGIGDKTADCMILLGFDMATMPVDTNVFKVISRLYPFEWSAEVDVEKNFKNPLKPNKVRDFLEDNLDKDYLLYQVAHTLFLLHGKYTCKHTSNCQECILCNECYYFENIKDSEESRFGISKTLKR